MSLATADRLRLEVCVDSLESALQCVLAKVWEQFSSRIDGPTFAEPEMLGLIGWKFARPCCMEEG